MPYIVPEDAGILFKDTGVPSYFGFVGSRQRVPNFPITGNKQQMARTGETAAEDLTDITLVYGGYYTSAGGAGIEQGLTVSPTDTADIEASIEYPLGIFTRVTFSGNNIGTLTLAPSTGATGPNNILASDNTPITIPAGATYWIRTFWSSAAGILISAATSRNIPIGDFHAQGVTTTNRVMPPNGTIGDCTQTAAGTSYGPTAIMGSTRTASIVLIGDSIMFGFGATNNAVDFRLGIIGTALPDGSTFVILGSPGATASNWYGRMQNGRYFIQFATHMANNLGINGGTIAQNQANAALFPLTCKKYLCTLTPRSTSTDAWTTLANQTAVNLAVNLAYNASVRAGVAGYDNFIEIRRASAGGLEGAPEDSGIWLVDPVNGAVTLDGLHPDQFGYNWPRDNGAVPASLWNYP